VNSALYEGWVRHRRFADVGHVFRYRVALAYLDTAELPQALDLAPLASATGRALVRLRREDLLGGRAGTVLPVDRAVRDLIAERTGVRPDGPVRLLTALRSLGVGFNPVRFYYAWHEGRLHAVIAEVTNTPWGERHAYVLPVGEASDHGSTHVLQGQFAKVLHVSPLMGMNHTYDWRLSEPSERLSVHIESLGDDGKRVFDATLSLCRSELTPRALRHVLTRYPALTMRLTARIYAHALRLRLRGATYHPHPERSPATSAGGEAGGPETAR
jgi:DUF1365 family protein